MKKKFTTFIACAVSSILACTFLPACAEEEIDVENQAIIGNWLCTDIPTEGMTSDQAAAFENYYMYLQFDTIEAYYIDKDYSRTYTSSTTSSGTKKCTIYSKIVTTYSVTYDGTQYDDVVLYPIDNSDIMNGFVMVIDKDLLCDNAPDGYSDAEFFLMLKEESSSYVSSIISVTEVTDSIAGSITVYQNYLYYPTSALLYKLYYQDIWVPSAHYEYYTDYEEVYDDNGNLEGYTIYRDITEDTAKENITLRITAYVTSEYYKDSSTTISPLTIDKNNSKYSADKTLYLRFNAGTEESYVFEMDGDNKLTMTSSTSIYSFTFNRTETSYTSFCANYDYSSLHIRNEAVVGSWFYEKSDYEIFIEIGASDKDTLYIKSAIVEYISGYGGGHYELTGEYTGTIEIEKSNSSYSVSNIYLNPDYGSASDYSITVMNDGSIFIKSTVTDESFSHSFSSVNISYDRFIESYD